MKQPGKLIPISVMCPDGTTVAMATVVNGTVKFVIAIARNGRWEPAQPEAPFGEKLLGWTGFDQSWDIRNG